MLQSIGFRRVGHDWMTDQQQQVGFNKGSFDLVKRKIIWKNVFLINLFLIWVFISVTLLGQALG